MRFLRQYWAERFPLPMAVGVPLLLAVAGQAGGSRSPSTFPADVLLAFMLFAQFRILDDLADRPRDAHTHPERVLVRTTSVRPLAALALVLWTATMAVLLARASSSVGPTFRWGVVLGPIGGCVLLIAVLSAWYATRGARSLFGDHLVLAKYPAFVWIIATSVTEQRSSGSSAQLALSMLATYLVACVYEARHDDESPAAARPALVAGESVLLVLTLTALVVPLLESFVKPLFEQSHT
jgi:4-hydroxybenzoate polyprenyltransferase